MRIRSLGALAGVLLISTACAKAATPVATMPAPAPAAAATANPVGRWTVALTAQGQAFDFLMDLRHVSGDEYSGTLTSQAFPTMPINKATRTGNSMMIKITAPTGDEATINIVFEGDTFTGEWSMPGDGSRVSGRRVPQ